MDLIATGDGSNIRVKRLADAAVIFAHGQWIIANHVPCVERGKRGDADAAESGKDAMLHLAAKIF